MRVFRSINARLISHFRMLMGAGILFLFYIVADLSIKAVQVENAKRELNKKGWDVHPSNMTSHTPMEGYSLPKNYSTGFGTFGLTEAMFHHFGESDGTFILDQDDAIIACRQPGLRGLRIYCQDQTLRSALCEATRNAEHLEFLGLTDFFTSDARAMRTILGNNSLRNLSIGATH